MSVALAAHRLRKRVTAYTFHLKGEASYDSTKAKEVANAMGWDCVVVEVPTNRVERDFLRLWREFGCVKKTHYECCFPFLYVYPQIKEHEVLSGWAADGYYGLSRKAMQHYRHTKKKFDEFRAQYFEEQNRAGYLWHHRIAAHYGKRMIAPYLSEPVRRFFWSKDWNELNKPRQKHHVRSAFTEFSRLGKIKPHLNLQLGAGVDHLFEEKLLSSKRINFNGRNRVMDVCRDWEALK